LIVCSVCVSAFAVSPAAAVTAVAAVVASNASTTAAAFVAAAASTASTAITAMSHTTRTRSCTRSLLVAKGDALEIVEPMLSEGVCARGTCLCAVFVFHIYEEGGCIGDDCYS
jgi:hypothetical protein